MKYHLTFGVQSHEIVYTCTVGRREGDIKFNDESVSGIHARFHIEEQRLFLTDLGSSNGTFLNTKRLEPNITVEVLHGDNILLGHQSLKVKTDESEDHTVLETLADIEKKHAHMADKKAALAASEPAPAPTPTLIFDAPTTDGELPSLAREKDNAPVEAPPKEKPIEVLLPEVNLMSFEKDDHTHVEQFPDDKTYIEDKSASPAKTLIANAEIPDAKKIILASETVAELIPLPPRKPVEVVQPKVTAIPAAAPASQSVATGAPSRPVATKDLATAPTSNAAIANPPVNTTPKIPSTGAKAKVTESLNAFAQTTKAHAIAAKPINAKSKAKKRPLVYIMGFLMLLLLAGAFAMKAKRNSQSLANDAANSRNIASSESTESASASDTAPGAANSGAAASAVVSESAAMDSVANNEVSQVPSTALPTPAIEAEIEKPTLVADRSVKAPKNIEITKEAVSISTEEAPADSVPKETADAKKKPVKAAAPKKKNKPTSKSETALLGSLSKFKFEISRTKSSRVRAAIEADAEELIALYYRSKITAINNQWKKSRGVASGNRTALKKSLLKEINEFKAREKKVEGKLPAYLKGKIKSPF